MSKHEQYFHWYLGENILRNDNATALFNLKLGVCVFFDYAEGYLIDYDDFYKSVANVQFFTGDRPDEIDHILIEAWNFLSEFEKKEDELLNDL